MSHQRGDARKRLTLVPTPCCDAAAKVARVEALIEAEETRVAEANARLEAEGRNVHPVYGIKWKVSGNMPTRDLRAALDGPAGGGGL